MFLLKTKKSEVSGGSFVAILQRLVGLLLPFSLSSSKDWRRWISRISTTSNIRKRYSVLFGVLFVVFTICYLWKLNLFCFNYEVERAISNLCQEFVEHKAVGLLCIPLCSRQIQLSSCEAAHGGKEWVFYAKTPQDETVVIKSRRVDYSQDISLDGNQLNPADFTESVRSFLKINMGINYPASDLLDRILPVLPTFSNNEMNEERLKNVWHLVQDTEYIHSVFYEEYGVFPKVLGTCGAFYAAEYLRPVTNLSYSDNSYENWYERVQLAKAMLTLIRKLRDYFEEPMHICDMKLSHFGWTSKGSLKIVDVDTVFPKFIVDRSTKTHGDCSKHSDCHFLDCLSVCNLETHQCDSPVLNNNLQILCQKIFLGYDIARVVEFPGLLSSPHALPPFQALLRTCADVGPSSHVVQSASLAIENALSETFDDILRFDPAMVKR